MNIKVASREILLQLLFVARELQSEDYSMPIEILSGFTLGQHLRHTLEFYICLKEGCTNGTVNYDKRKRDIQIETEPSYAINAINDILSFIDDTPDNQNISLEVNYSLDSDEKIIVDSNMKRELCYNIEHAIHHMALIKIGIKEIASYVDLPEGFGIAVSTLRHLKSTVEEA